MAFQPLSHRLLDAATQGDISLIRKLFNNKVQTEFLDEQGNSPLNLAVKHNHVCAAKLLIEYGANIEHANKQLHRPVHIATMNRDQEMLVMLLSRGASFNQLNHEGFTPIQLTAYGSNVYKVLFDAQDGKLADEWAEVNEVPIIPDYSIPVPKVKSDKKGKKDKKGKSGKKGGKKKKKR